MEIAYPDFMDNKGVLYVIFNTSKGKNLSSKTKYYFEIINLDIAIIKKYNKTLTSAVKRPEIRNTFYSSLNTDGYVEVYTKKYLLKVN